MKVNEVLKTKKEALRESIDRVNNTGVSTDDLVKIAEAQETNNWTEHASAEDFFRHLEMLEK